MKRHLITAAALLSTLLAGCTVNYHQPYPYPPCAACTQGGPVDPARPMVQIVGGEITVDQQVLRFRKDQTNIDVVWSLPKGYTFPENGVVFESSAAGELTCRRGEGGLVFTCLNRHGKPGVYRYGINVNRADGSPLKPLDPFLMND